MSWALKSERVGRFRKLAGNEFQTVGAMKLKEKRPFCQELTALYTHNTASTIHNAQATIASNHV